RIRWCHPRALGSGVTPAARSPLAGAVEIPYIARLLSRSRVMGYKVAVVGATGNVGHEMLNILAEREVPADEVVALASRKSIGKEVSFGDKTLKPQWLDNFDFSGTDIVLMSAGGSVSGEWSPKIAKQGPVVIDNSSKWRMDPDVPLIVPEVNIDALA